MSPQMQRCSLLLCGLILTSTAVASAQRPTIPDAIARGGIGSAATVPSGPNPSVTTLLASTDILVFGRLGQPRSYLSGDQTEVFTDYNLEDAMMYFERIPRDSRRFPEPPR
jgi:hypothetical protein